MTDLKMRVQGFKVWCEGGICKVTVVTEQGDIDTEVGQDQVGPMLHTMLQNGVTLSFKDTEIKADPYRLQNLKAERAAAEANLKVKQSIGGTGYAQSMREHQAQIQALFLEGYIEDLTKEIEELESNE